MWLRLFFNNLVADWTLLPYPPWCSYFYVGTCETAPSEVSLEHEQHATIVVSRDCFPGLMMYHGESGTSDVVR